MQGPVPRVGRIASVPTILDVVCRTTGMRFAAVAHVTPERWIECSVLDRRAGSSTLYIFFAASYLSLLQLPPWGFDDDADCDWFANLCSFRRLLALRLYPASRAIASHTGALGILALTGSFLSWGHSGDRSFSVSGSLGRKDRPASTWNQLLTTGSELVRVGRNGFDSL